MFQNYRQVTFAPSKLGPCRIPELRLWSPGPISLLAARALIIAAEIPQRNSNSPDMVTISLSIETSRKIPHDDHFKSFPELARLPKPFSCPCLALQGPKISDIPHKANGFTGHLLSRNGGWGGFAAACRLQLPVCPETGHHESSSHKNLAYSSGSTNLIMNYVLGVCRPAA